MITEQIILGIYIVLLLEVAFLLLVLVLIVWDIRRSFNSVYKLINKFTELGHITIKTAEEFGSKLNSLSNLSSIIGVIPEIVNLFRNWSGNSLKDKDIDKDEADLEQALSRVAVPKKKRRII